MTIAEESTAFGGVTRPTGDWGLGFDLKWNMGWMHDTLQYFGTDPLYRKYHHNDLTFGMLYQYSENFMLAYSHDEVVHGKGSMLMKMGSWSIADKARTLRALYGFMWGWPGKKTLFMGCEFGQSSEWKYDSALDWHLLRYADHDGTRLCVRDLNRFYLEEKALGDYDLRPEGFRWINCTDGENSVISFLRCGSNANETFLVIANFTPVDRDGYRVGVPYAGVWEERINTNASVYGGTGAGNCGMVTTEATQADGCELSLNLFLPGLTTLIFRHRG